MKRRGRGGGKLESESEETFAHCWTIEEEEEGAPIIDRVLMKSYVLGVE